MAVYDFDPPERFIADTVGPPGERTFFLQATGDRRVVTVSLEKQQVDVLGDRLDDLLDEVAAEESGEQAAQAVLDNAPLDTPFEDDFRAAALSLAWDAGRRVVVIEAHEHAEPDDPEELAAWQEHGPGEVLRVALAPDRARAFARRCARAVAGGRPNCPFCGQPLDPSGHICPRANGYRR